MKKYILILIISMFTISCATSYQSIGFTGGYSETQLDENIFQVSFIGNGYTSRERCDDYALLRCAELSLMNGFEYFIIVDSKEYISNSSYTTPTQSRTTATLIGNQVVGKTTTTGGQTYNISKPSSKNTIVCFKEKPNDFSYNANFLISSLKKKYNID